MLFFLKRIKLTIGDLLPAAFTSFNVDAVG